MNRDLVVASTSSTPITLLPNNQNIPLLFTTLVEGSDLGETSNKIPTIDHSLPTKIEHYFTKNTKQH